jgi:hypothetical protein
MVAARMAVPFLQEVELGKRPKLPKSIKRQSLNEMAAFVAGKPDRASRRMSKAGSGGRALRVIHLAVLILATLLANGMRRRRIAAAFPDSTQCSKPSPIPTTRTMPKPRSGSMNMTQRSSTSCPSNTPSPHREPA